MIDENTSRKAFACAPVDLFGHSPPASLPFDQDDDHDYRYQDYHDNHDNGGGDDDDDDQ